MGWSVKKTLMGKTIYNDVGQKIGTVEDLIVSPERNVSYVIVGAGGLVGVGRHDVAIPVAQNPSASVVGVRPRARFRSPAHGCRDARDGRPDSHEKQLEHGKRVPVAAYAGNEAVLAERTWRESGIDAVPCKPGPELIMEQCLKRWCPDKFELSRSAYG